MAVRIGHASNGENGARGGVAGDQTGKEVCIRDWYAGNWNVVLRPIDSKIAEKIAAACEAGCANDRIGYDQNERNTLRAQAKLVKYDLSKIKTACETDCSAFVSVCVECAGVNMDKAYSYGNAPTTWTLREKLTATGAFTALIDSKYLTGDRYLKRGDILLRESGHVAMVLTNGTGAEPVKTTVSASQYIVKEGDTLWGIAERELGSGSRYLELMRLNGLVSASIYPGMRLKLK